MRQPVIFYSGNTVVKPGLAVVVRGEFFDGIEKAELVSVRTGKTAELQLLQRNRQSFKFIIPRDFPEGSYRLVLHTGAGEVTRILNAPVIRWVQGNEGAAATPGGWLRVNGECLRINEAEPFIRIEADGSEISIRPSRVYDDYSVRFDIPELGCGTYRFVYSNGYEETGSVFEVAESPEDRWPRTVYDVTEHGVATDQVTDVTEAVSRVLDMIRKNGGGILYFPAGRYHVTGTFEIPRHTVIRGDGLKKSQIFWTDVWNEQKDIGNGETHWSPTRTPDGMLRGEGEFAIEDMDFAASRIGSFIMSGDEGSPAKDIRIDRVRISANAFSGWFLHSRYGEKFHKARGAVLWETMRCRTDMISICGENVKIRDCDFQWSARPFAFRGGLKYLLMQNVKFGGQAAVDDWMPLGRLENSIVEDIEIHEWITGMSGTNIYFSRVKIRDVVDNDREAFTTDISYGTPYHGTMDRIDGNSFTFPEGTNMDRVKTGGTLCVLSGTGAGQYRRISKVEGTVVTVAEPFEVQPDETSRITANDMFTNWYFVNNSITNSGSLQFYTAQCNTVVDGTEFTHSASIKSWGQFVYDAISSHWYISFINNHISDCNYYHYAGWYLDPKIPACSFICCFGESDITTSMAVTVRNNRLEYNSAVNLRGGECDRGIEDLVIDSNLFEDCRCAIYAEGRGSNILVSGNSFVNCEKDIIFTDEETAERTLILK
jgi:hypothetical protein